MTLNKVDLPHGRYPHTRSFFATLGKTNFRCFIFLFLCLIYIHCNEAKQKLEFSLDVSGNNVVRLGTTMRELMSGRQESFEFAQAHFLNS